MSTFDQVQPPLKQLAAPSLGSETGPTVCPPPQLPIHPPSRAAASTVCCWLWDQILGTQCQSQVGGDVTEHVGRPWRGERSVAGAWVAQRGGLLGQEASVEA